MIFGNDILKRKTYAQGTVLTNGDYVKGAESWGNPEQCDAVPNGKGEKRSFDGGEARVYSYTIELSPGATPFKIGDHILLTAAGQDAREYIVLGYHPYSTVSKIWV